MNTSSCSSSVALLGQHIMGRSGRGAEITGFSSKCPQIPSYFVGKNGACLAYPTNLL